MPPRRDWPETIAGPLEGLTVRLIPIVGTGPDHDLYRELLARFHYLGYYPIRGSQLRYRIDSTSGSCSPPSSTTSTSWKS